MCVLRYVLRCVVRYISKDGLSKRKCGGIGRQQSVREAEMGRSETTKSAGTRGFVVRCIIFMDVIGLPSSPRRPGLSIDKTCRDRKVRTCSRIALFSNRVTNQWEVRVRLPLRFALEERAPMSRQSAGDFRAL
jgi:hypothetical protein